MNLITKDYKSYKLQIQVQKVLLILICLLSLYLAYLGVMFLKDTTALSAYSNIETQIKQSEEDIATTDAQIIMLDTELQKLDEFLMQETPTEDELMAFHVNNIMYNLLESTNNGTKLHNVLVIGNQMEITGVSNDISEVASIVNKLSRYYDVDINKTQKINHNGEGLYYAFKFILTGRGND